ncbi:MAG: GNAT family N-acetyltransferase [Pararhodobacter sp.]
MTAPHLTPVPGRAADFGAILRATLPVLRTSRTVLRAPRLEDATLWCTILTDDTAGHLGGPFDPDSAFADFAATVGMWLLRGHGMWTVTDHDDAPLGFVLIGFESGDREPELGFLFCAHARGRGLAFEAALAARDHALDVLGLPGLVSYIAPSNAPSRRLAERLGARLEGLLAYAGDDEPSEIWRHFPKVPA